MIEDIEQLVKLKLIRKEKHRKVFQQAQQQTYYAEEQRTQREIELANHEAFRTETKKQETANLLAANCVGKNELLKYRERVTNMATRSAELSHALEESIGEVEKAKASEAQAYQSTLRAKQDLEKIQLLYEELAKKLVIEERLEEDTSQDDLVSDITSFQFSQKQR